MPEVYRRLLCHEEHMTVAMEAHHESMVDVEVLNVTATGDDYARKILLHRQSDRAVVQFGIVRINMSLLSKEVRNEIEQQTRPLGRILVRHNVLRTVHLDQLWNIVPGEDLRQTLQCQEAESTFGRTATIDLDGQRAVDVVEIVAPVH